MLCLSAHEPTCSCSCLHPLVRPEEDREVISKQLLASNVSWCLQEEHIKGSPSLSAFLSWAVTAATLSNPRALHLLYPEKQQVPVGWTSYGLPQWLCGVLCRIAQAGPQATVCTQYFSWDCKVAAHGMSSCSREVDLGVLSLFCSSELQCHNLL